MRLALAICCLIGLAGAASPAVATTTVRADEKGDLVQITDETGDVNTLTVSSGESVVTVRDDSAPLQAGDACDAGGDGTVRCPVHEFSRIDIRLGAGDDRATVTGGVTAWVFGDEGADTLRTGGGYDDRLDGGSQDDTLDGGPGPDEAAGGPGDDTIRGGTGRDTLRGGTGLLIPGSGPAAGRDALDGGPGHDLLGDDDSDGPEIGPDVVIGGTGFDDVYSYSQRTANVFVNLSQPRGDGEHGEDDHLQNVEGVSGGRGDDLLIGDGDDNQLFGFRGSNRIRGRGGDDWLSARGSSGRNSMTGDTGADLITTEPYNSGVIRCGPGSDRVEERTTGLNAPRPMDPEAPGPAVLASCEAIGQNGNQWAVDPVPDAPAARTLLFARPAGASHGRMKELAVTLPDPPYTELGHGASKRHGIKVRLPAGIARRARSDGVTLRAEVYTTAFGSENRVVQTIWRFPLGPG